MLSSKHGDPQLGIDIHLCLTPPSIPLPSLHISVVFDPFDYIPFIGATVTVCGMKRTVAGTGGIAVHIPFAPFLPKFPATMDNQLFMGSKTVDADGDPFSYIALPVLSCQIIGMPPPPRLKKRGFPTSLLLPTVVNLAIPTNVSVGGPPTISILGMLGQLAQVGLLKKLGKLSKSKAGKWLGKAFAAGRKRLFGGLPDGFLKCKILRAEPVNILTGAVSVEQEDFTLSGLIPLQWIRSYTSNNPRQGICGKGWETLADARLEIDHEEGFVFFTHPVVGPALFPHVPQAEGKANAVMELMNGALLIDLGEQYQVETKDGIRYEFSKELATVNANGDQEYPIDSFYDRCGNGWTFERIEGRVTRIKDTNGRVLITKVRNGLLREIALYIPETGFEHTFVRYEYDQDNNLIAVKDALDQPYTFGYEKQGMVRHTNRNGLSFYYAYDDGKDNARVIHAWGDGGLYDYRFEYFDELNERRITDSLGGVSLIKLDNLGLPINEIDPLGGQTIFEYDDAGRTTAVIDPANHRTQYEYDERGNIIKLTRPDGTTVITEFDEDNNPISITDPNGHQWQQQWDERGLLLEQASPLGNKTAYTYTPSGLPTSIINPRQAETTLHFDSDGYLAALIDAQQNATYFEHDPLGNLTQRKDPLGHITTYHYDAKGRLIESRLSSGARIFCEYDPQDNLIRYVDENGAETRLEYFGQGEIKKRIQPDGHVVEYHYDTEEQLIGLTNQRGEIYHLKRDALGRVIEEIDYWGQSRHYAYDEAGYIQQSIDPLNRITQYETDPLGRINKKIQPHPEQSAEKWEEGFKFDENGNLTETKNQHIAISRQFDAEGNLLKESQGDFSVEYRYDPNGNCIERQTSAGNKVQYTYDLLDQVSSIQINDESPIEITRDKRGQITKEIFNDQLTRHMRYDAEGLITAQGLQHNDEWRFSTRFTYDAAGNLTQRNDSQYGSDQYHYDPMGRILKHIDPRGKITEYLNDPAGDRLQTRIRQSEPYSTEQQTIKETNQWIREGYHRNDDNTAIFYQFDSAGNLIYRREDDQFATAEGKTLRTSRFQWDANQRLIKSETNGIITTYAYDPLGRRLHKETNGQRTCFYWDGDALVGEEVRVTKDIQLLSKHDAQLIKLGIKKPQISHDYQNVREYVYYPETFEPLALVECKSKQSSDEANTNNTRLIYYYQNEPNGSPTRLTDYQGTTVWAVNYSAWGSIRQQHVDEVHNPIRLQGQYQDDETGLYYNRHRYYDSAIGAFVSQDPLGLKAGENIYNFASNIMRWTDPLGLEKKHYSDKGLIEDLAEKIKNKYGDSHLVGTERKVYRPDGSTATDFDIETKNAVVQVKSRSGTGSLKQALETQMRTDKVTIVYGPKLGKHVIRDLEKHGILVTRDEGILLDILKPDSANPSC